eukprot:TRINITY_DN5418_c0_g1_i1.p1 TRINITY_DN5418_c0_g1~~TRINITY_DN5418_c0_g1_i1.p1  ORF type:complete len:373 (-),score=80.16 TRINITY_DN5418_c0_g1_i1:141-1259(-)
MNISTDVMRGGASSTTKKKNTKASTSSSGPYFASHTTALTVATILGSGSAGMIELGLFHPVDTVVKRLMTNRAPITHYRPHHQPALKAASELVAPTTLASVIFKDASEKGALSRYKALFPGFGFATAYKVAQRVWRFGGQAVLKEAIDKHHNSTFERIVGRKHARTLNEAISGSFIGLTEVALLPLDVLKIKLQTDPKCLQGRGLRTLWNQVKISQLYAGAGITIVRNIPGSFALFGGSALARDYLFGINDPRKATFWQHLVAASVGASISILLTSPLDVVKTRVQTRAFDLSFPTAGAAAHNNNNNNTTHTKPLTARGVWRELLREEGLRAGYKGVLPKLLTIGPKVVLSYTMAQCFIGQFSRLFTTGSAN